MKDLVCPYCGSELSLDYEFAGGAYSEYQTVRTIDCDNYACGAEWNAQGKAVTDSRLDGEA